MSGVVRTDEWLLKDYNHPIKITKRVESYFSNAEAEEIYSHLTKYGMYRKPLSKKRIKQMQDAQIWKIIDLEYAKLKKEWSGPDVPIFIFPSDTNHRLMKEYNGKSGLTFKDKIFLFVFEGNTESEIHALLTHEYNHVCRLNKYQKPEEKYTLLDTIILEGMAEYAVRKQLGKDYTATYIGKYTDETLKRFWNKLILPNAQLKAGNKKYVQLLYGSQFYPKMLGYCVGEYLVRNYANTHNMSVKDLFQIKSEEIADVQ
ncbi:DUF2268 domain-containing protein [Virgibacillus proomii]|uniref:DUF2268 domain-containing protein n=1 Tax=Virgibacillus proomii TaxID=84407 RepID=UPI001C111DFD|nr:DUF2268 domain-containing putative Zn-dependent protease [Virgibacillus proomii]MBU5266443.1 DUF2268 domain-containing protein [Virgibacillus proomii]